MRRGEDGFSGCVAKGLHHEPNARGESTTMDTWRLIRSHLSDWSSIRRGAERLEVVPERPHLPGISLSSCACPTAAVTLGWTLVTQLSQVRGARRSSITSPSQRSRHCPTVCRLVTSVSIWSRAARAAFSFVSAWRCVAQV